MSAPPLPDFVALMKLLNFLMPQIPYLKIEGNDSTYLLVLPRCIEIMHAGQVKYLMPGVKELSINAS